MAWEFAGCQVVKFGHPWVPASFAWYPWLWLAFHHAWETGSRRAVAGTALATAAVFYAGNLQSHTYLPLFLGALVAGYGGGRPAGWAKALRPLAPGILLGACLAAPILAAEIEFFRQNVRHTDVGVPTKPWLAAALSLVGMGHPWALGTFQTLDASKLAGQFALGFRLFAGTAVLGGAWVATLGRDRKLGLSTPVRAGLWMGAAYFAVLATPLVNLLYPRAAGLAVIGLVVMGAHGLDRLRNDPRAWPRAGRLVLAWLLGITLTTHALAYGVWPKAQERVAAMLAERSAGSALGEAPALRASQLGRFPAEISFADPEALLAAAGWVMLAALLLRPAWRAKPLLWHATLALNLAPLLLFAGRYIPRHEMALWQKIQAGTPAQRQVASVLAAGGGSWPKLGSDGAWAPLLIDRGVVVAPLRPSNCGFDVDKGWSEHFRTRFAGHPLKPVVLAFTDRNGVEFRRQGEFVVTGTGVEGSLVYAASAAVRDEIEAVGGAVIRLDLLPDRSPERVLHEVAHPRGSRSLSSHLQSRTGITGVKMALLRELVPADALADPARLAEAIKALPVPLAAPRPIDESISTAGGVPFEALDDSLMVRALPGVFCAGEMLDWEAPTGGYLLTACFATGQAAGQGALGWLGRQ